jgi:hypothetical protein
VTGEDLLLVEIGRGKEGGKEGLMLTFKMRRRGEVSLGSLSYFSGWVAHMPQDE